MAFGCRVLLLRSRQGSQCRSGHEARSPANMLEWGFFLRFHAAHCPMDGVTSFINLPDFRLPPFMQNRCGSPASWFTATRPTRIAHSRLMYQSHGPRFLAGDFNLLPSELHLELLDQWRALGFREVQDIFWERAGIEPRPTCKHCTRKDYLFLSPELQEALVSFHLDDTIFPDHSVLSASLGAVPSPGCSGACLVRGLQARMQVCCQTILPTPPCKTSTCNSQETRLRRTETWQAGLRTGCRLSTSLRASLL